MKKLLVLLLGLVFLIVGCSLDNTTYVDEEPYVPTDLNALVINEFMSHNDVAWAGPNNEFPDWIELYNGTSETIDVGRMYVTDDLGDLQMSMIGDDAPELTTMAPGSYLVLIANKTPELGPLQVDLKLGDNEDFALVLADGSTIVDQHYTEVVPDDMSMGRVPDGTDNIQICTVHTPGASNQ